MISDCCGKTALSNIKDSMAVINSARIVIKHDHIPPRMNPRILCDIHKIESYRYYW